MNDSIFSTDKLVEFGMGLTVANQIVASMNTNIQAMNQKQSNQSSVNEIYYVVLENSVAGPFSLTEISRLISEKKIVKETYVWKAGMQDWTLVENVPEILKYVALNPPPIPQDKE
ncbi:MAG: DUF4339 domain-containing protein [Clostridiales bacterium]|nr:DUF4339 domain-containing protein [Clostridiales bacterium]